MLGSLCMVKVCLCHKLFQLCMCWFNKNNWFENCSTQQETFNTSSSFNASFQWWVQYTTNTRILIQFEKTILMCWQTKRISSSMQLDNFSVIFQLQLLGIVTEKNNHPCFTWKTELRFARCYLCPSVNWVHWQSHQVWYGFNIWQFVVLYKYMYNTVFDNCVQYFKMEKFFCIHGSKLLLH